ncbi:MAG: glycoside hydrolase family 97 protein [Muribaculaceae bacterium]|nr:glycoside hydrolase family 97 protein [Muribaculaceae bacterium]
MRKSFALCFALALCVFSTAYAKTFTISSPDGNLSINVNVDKDITWNLSDGSTSVIAPSKIAMEIDDKTIWGSNPKVQKVTKSKISATHTAQFYKKSEVKEECNTLTIHFKGNFAIEFRAYNNAAAYRFVSTNKGNNTVKNEIADFVFDNDNTVYCSYVRGNENKTIEEQYKNSFENLYELQKMSEMKGNRLMFMPVLVDLGDKKVCITESNLVNYPGMYLYNPTGNTTLNAHFAPYPDKVEQGGYINLQGIVKSRKPYIAEVSGARAFPWRICIVAHNDVELLDNDMVFLLSEPSVIDDTSWIKPGKVAWDWWNAWGLVGVPFKAGINNRTYEYYIDFAANNGIEYILLDDGWSPSGKADLMQVIPEIDIPHLVNYAKDKGVGVVLWAGYWATNRDMDMVFKHYSQMGVKGFKIDFMDHDDQQMVEFYERAAATAAKYKLFVDFHGAYKPSGLSRKYPNVMGYEGVYGLETRKWAADDIVTYDVQIPFIRMIAGPIDYTQGAMMNSQMSSFRASNNEPMSMGTRCHQLGMYVIYESPFNMLCDSPTNYEKEPVCTEFIADVPTVWDETVALDGKVSEYAIVARRAGNDWYIGGLNNWDAREVVVDLSFLPDGKYTLTLLKDGYNADKFGRDFLKETTTNVTNATKLPIRMAVGGGFALKLAKE